MSNQTDKVFAKGIYFFSNPQQPEWVVGTLSMNVEEAVQFLKDNANSEGKIKLSIKKAKSEKFYLELDTYQAAAKIPPQENKSTAEILYPKDNPFEDAKPKQGVEDLPF